MVLITATFRATATSLFFVLLTTHSAIPVLGQGTDTPIVDQQQKVKIEKVLNSKVTFEFQQKPLNEIVALIRKEHGINVQINKLALEEIGYPEDHELSINVKNISMRSALNILLTRMDMAYQVKNGILFLTSAESAEEDLVTKIYRVTDLISPNRTDVVVKSKSYSRTEELIEVIMSDIEPDTWEDYGGPSSIRKLSGNKEELYIVSSTSKVHNRVDQFLKQLRKIKATPQSVQKNRDGKKTVTKVYTIREELVEKPSMIQQYAELLQTAIAAKSWAEKEHYVLPIAGTLVVRNSPKIQSSVKEFLEDIDALKSAKN